jgi:predicted Rossmann-fold nucleotide-binding protein
MKLRESNQNKADPAASASVIAEVSSGLHGKYNGSNSSFSLAFMDNDYLTSPETRGVRFQLEIGKADVVFRQMGIKHTIVVFGSARFKSPDVAKKMLSEAKSDEELRVANLAVKNSVHYQKAYDFSQIVANRNLQLPVDHRLYILTGGGPGVMEAANRGAFEAGDKTIGMNIALPFEQEPNPYITPELCFDFHYFACRKFSFLSAGSSTPGVNLIPGEGMTEKSEVGGGGAAAMVCFAGGFGSLDEWFEALTLIQTGKMRPRPMILVGKDYWNKFMNIDFLVEEGAVSPEDLKLFHIVDTPSEAWEIIKDFYKLNK